MATLKETAKKLGLSYNGLQNRLCNGWNVWEALSTPKISNEESMKRACSKITKYYYKGKPISQILSKEEYNRFRDRIHRGWSVTEAMKKTRERNKPYKYKGVRIAKLFDKKDYGVVLSRICRQGWSVERAMTYPVIIPIGKHYITRQIKIKWLINEEH